MKKIFTLLLICLLFTTGCSISLQSKKTTNLGVYKSSDYGETWQQKVFAGLTKKKAQIKISGVNITKISINPKDDKTIYLCTLRQGLYRTKDAGEIWSKTGLREGTFLNVDFDNDHPEIIYTLTKNKIYKSTDDGEKWETIYLETQENQTLTDLAVDHDQTNIVYTTTTKGALLKSTDYGISWHVYNRFDYPLKKIYINPADSRNIVILTDNYGLYLSYDQGNSWSHLYEDLKEINKKATRINDFAFYQTDPKLIYFATEYGLFKSIDGLDSVKEVKTLIKKGYSIEKVGIDPSNSDTIYLIKTNKIHRSDNEGADWKTIQLPNSASVSDLKILVNQPNVLYLGFYNKK